MSIHHDHTAIVMSRAYKAGRFSQAETRSSDPTAGRRSNGRRTSESLRSVRRRGAAVYLLGMLIVTGVGSAFVIGGMLAEAQGLAAVALAAAMPIAGLLWAITLSIMSRD